MPAGRYYFSAPVQTSFRYIAVEGVIGAGKTTLATRLARHFSARLLLESFVDNPFLDKFYRQPDRYAFPLEMSFMAERFQQLKTVLHATDLFGQPVVSDYIFPKSLLFARTNLKEAEYNLFQTLYRIMAPQLSPPDLLIYLQCPVEKLLQHIHKRGRPYELGISPKYLQSLADIYESFLRQPPCPVLIVSRAEVDFNTYPDHFNRLAARLAGPSWRGTEVLQIN